MRLSAPKRMTWWISIILAIIAVLAESIPFISFLQPYAFIILIVGFLLLLSGTFIKGL